MKKFLMLTALCLSMASCLTAHAEADKAPKESKMGQCHKTAKAKNLAGDERKAFMKECLSAKGPATEPAKTSPQEDAMNACKAEAQKLKGNARQEKMQACLKS